MRRLSSRTARALATSVIATGALLLAVVPATAQPSDDPVSGDARATAYAGNITAEKDGCAGAGLDGEVIEVEASIEDNIWITITGIPAGYELTGVVVKGGPAYNVYEGDIREDLHAPMNPNEQNDIPAEISHWFACGIEVDETETTETETTETETETTETETTETETETTETETTETETTTTEETTTAPSVTTTTSAGGGGGNEDDGLADTGVSALVPISIAVALLALGAGLVLLARRRALGRS